MAENLTEDQRAAYRKAFGKFDENGDGTITLEEFSNAMRNMGYNPKDTVLLQMFDEIDKDGSGEVDLDEFVILMSGWNEGAVEFRKRLGGFAWHLSMCLPCCLVDVTCCVLLWSNVGWAPLCLDGLGRLQESWLPMIFASIALACLLLLYMLDFFLPPHLPGKMFTVGGKGVGASRVMFGIACLLLFVFCLSAVHDVEFHPHRPLLLTLILAPFSVTLVNVRIKSMRDSAQKSMARNLSDNGSRLELTLFRIVSSAAIEENDVTFYRAALVAFCSSGFCCLCVWVAWVQIHGFPGPSQGATADLLDNEEVWIILWMSPSIVILVMWVLAASIFLRLFVHEAYSFSFVSTSQRTSQQRISSSMGVGSMGVGHFGSIAGKAAGKAAGMFKKTISTGSENTVCATESGVATALDQAEERQQGRLRELKKMLKICAAVCICTIGLLMVASDVAIPDSAIGNMVVEVLVLLLSLFGIFMILTFRRLLKRLKNTLKSMPLWQSIMLVLSSEWTFALAVCIFGPFCGLYLLLSFLNQCVRRWRGLLPAGDDSPALRKSSTWNSIPSLPSGVSEKMLGHLTERVRTQVLRFGNWDVASVGMKVHVVSVLLAIVFLCPLLFNILFAAIIDLINPLDAGWILLIVFALGVAVLMIPAVPTTALYVFAGVVFSQKWMSLPPEYGGFWTGTLLCIFLCVFIKLVGRILQYKCFGQCMGGSLWVQHACKLHTPLMCAVEGLMSEPGICKLGKIAVLCGVPDWPMGVGAGILRLPLCSVLLGTVPIAFFVSPCVLSGSFYTRKDDGELWNRAFVAMVLAMGVVSIIFQVIAAMAVQRILNTHAKFLSKPREEHVELHWLDHFHKEIRSAQQVRWKEIPVSLRIVGFTGVFLQVLVCQILIWAWNYCFGTFAVADDIKDLTWYGENGIIQPAGFLCLVIMTAAFVSAYLAKRWMWRGKREFQMSLAASLHESKEEWVKNWLAGTMVRNSRISNDSGDVSWELRDLGPEARESMRRSFSQLSCLDAVGADAPDESSIPRTALHEDTDDEFTLPCDLPAEKFQPPNVDFIDVLAWLRPSDVSTDVILSTPRLKNSTQVFPHSPRPVVGATSPRLPPDWTAAAALGEALRCGRTG